MTSNLRLNLDNQKKKKVTDEGRKRNTKKGKKYEITNETRKEEKEKKRDGGKERE